MLDYLMSTKEKFLQEVVFRLIINIFFLNIQK